VRRTVPPSAEIEEQIDRLLSVGVGESPRESLSVLARLGARLIIQRAVEDEFDAWLGRARYERRPEYQRGLRNYDSGLRNGFRPRRVQTAEGELSVDIPQVREAAEPFVSKLFPCRAQTRMGACMSTTCAAGTPLRPPRRRRHYGAAGLDRHDSIRRPSCAARVAGVLLAPRRGELVVTVTARQRPSRR
jgi:hypothetical protein